jgi:hypothetical protein
MMKPEHLRVHDVLLNTNTLLCKNSLRFCQTLRIEGVIGITLDGKDVFIVHANETINADNTSIAVGVGPCEVPATKQSFVPMPPNHGVPSSEPDRRCAGDSFRHDGTVGLTATSSSYIRSKRTAGRKRGRSFAVSSTVIHESFARDEETDFAGDMFADTNTNDGMVCKQEAFDSVVVIEEDGPWHHAATDLPVASYQQQVSYTPARKQSAGIGRAKPKQVDNFSHHLLKIFHSLAGRN